MAAGLPKFSTCRAYALMAGTGKKQLPESRHWQLGFSLTAQMNKGAQRIKGLSKPTADER